MRARSLPPWADPRAHGPLWATTIAAAVTVALVPDAAPAVRNALGFQFASTDGSLAEGTAIAFTNLRVVGGVLAASWIVARFRPLQAVLDAWVAFTLTTNAVAVGAAVGAYGTRTLIWLIHLPLEWVALGAAASFYLRARSAQHIETIRSPALLATSMLVAAALVESYAAP